MEVKRKIKLKCMDGNFEFTVKLDRYDRDRPVAYLSVKRYSLNLACIHYGIVKHRFELNHRLRSEKSKLKELNNLLDSIVEYLIKIQKTIVVKEVITSGHRASGFVTMPTNDQVELNNIKSIESGQVVSWYGYDLYKSERTEVKVKIKRVDNRLEFYMLDSDLYDETKINEFIKTDSFKNKKLSFFFYDELNRLAGLPFKNVKSMSGLFN